MDSMAASSAAHSASASPSLDGVSILDAHVHLYDPNAITYDWMSAVPALNQLHGPADYWAQASQTGIENAIWVEVNAALDEYRREAELAAEWASDDSRFLGLVACAPLDQGAAVATDVAAVCQLQRLAGLRTLLETHANQPGWSLSEPFVSMLRATCGPDGPVFDLCIRARQLREVAQLVDRCPQTSFVLDHCGKPEIGGTDEARWRDDLASLAERPNVFCKLSGLATEVADGDANADRIAPFLRHALDVFGPERTMFASDWPICTLAMPLTGWVRCVAEVVAPIGKDAVAQVFRRTAERAYRLQGSREASA